MVGIFVDEIGEGVVVDLSTSGLISSNFGSRASWGRGVVRRLSSWMAWRASSPSKVGGTPGRPSGAVAFPTTSRRRHGVLLGEHRVPRSVMTDSGGTPALVQADASRQCGECCVKADAGVGHLGAAHRRECVADLDQIDRPRTDEPTRTSGWLRVPR